MPRRPSLPLLMSFNGGYVDTVGFLALQGLFTAHVTGNFVTFGAAMIQGSDGVIAKLLALPVFCAAILASRLLSFFLASRGLPVLRTMLRIQVGLLVLGSILAVTLSPFPRGDSVGLILTGMTFVSAMAIQNAAHKVYLADAPPSTMMTGTTTQFMLDVADLFRVSPALRPAVLDKLKRLGGAVAAFAIGCGLAALGFATFGQTAFWVTPVVALFGLFSREAGAREVAA